MCVSVYIYIYTLTHLSLSISIYIYLSLSIYIYIHYNDDIMSWCAAMQCLDSQHILQRDDKQFARCMPRRLDLTSWYSTQLFVALCGSLWLFVALCGSLWLFVALCGSFWLFVALCGSLWHLRNWGNPIYRISNEQPPDKHSRSLVVSVASQLIFLCSQQASSWVDIQQAEQRPLGMYVCVSACTTYIYIYIYIMCIHTYTDITV